jgi:hypothetical protein
MTYEELKPLLAQSEILKLDKDHKYIICVSPNLVPASMFYKMGPALKEMGIDALVLFPSDIDNAVRVLELKT